MRGKLKKLRRASFAELRVRGGQAFTAFLERHDWSARARIPSDQVFLNLLDNEKCDLKPRTIEAFHEHFRRRKAPRFFESFAGRTATVAELRRRWPDWEPMIVEVADRIIDGRFELLGFRDLSFGSPIDWHLEPIAGKRSPLIHWSKLNYLDGQQFGDKKIVWELNRHQYLVTLGQAYWLTEDERYSETFARHIEEWAEQNPPKLGINWASSLEVAFRSISWLWALYFFRDSNALTPDLAARIAKGLYLNALHLESFLSTYFSPNTHLTGEALGLFYIGTLMPEFKDSERWRKRGLQILIEQLNVHVQSDGVYFEQSSYYHRYTTDFYLHLLLLLESNRKPVEDIVVQKLRQLLDHLMFITRPDGSSPLYGDDDGGRLVKLDYRPSNDFRATLAVGAAVFESGEYKFVAGDSGPEVLWLVGPAGMSKLDRVVECEPPVQSMGFENSGYYVMRDGWSRDSDYLLFDCGHHGTDNCGHAHADALSFELAANGCTFVVDPGTFTYTGSKEMRDWFRSSAGHNTLTVDDQGSSVPAGPFSWKSIAKCKRLCWITQSEFDYIMAAHDGFDRLEAGTRHFREIFFVKGNYWVITDYLESSVHRMMALKSTTRKLTARLHFDSGVEPLRSHSRGMRVVGENGAVLQLAAFAKQGEWTRELGPVSHCYGSRVEAPVFSFTAQNAEEVTTFALPESFQSAAVAEVREIEALFGRAFEINSNDKHDVLMLRGALNPRPNKVETARFVSDFDVAWIRFANQRTRNPEELVLIGGQTIELDGRVLLKSTKPIDYLVARAAGEVFQVKTNEGILELSLPVTNLELLLAELQPPSV